MSHLIHWKQPLNPNLRSTVWLPYCHTEVMFLRELIANYSARDSDEATFQALAHWTNSIFLEGSFFLQDIPYYSRNFTNETLLGAAGWKATLTWTLIPTLRTCGCPSCSALLSASEIFRSRGWAKGAEGANPSEEFCRWALLTLRLRVRTYLYPQYRWCLFLNAFCCGKGKWMTFAVLAYRFHARLHTWR